MEQEIACSQKWNRNYRDKLSRFRFLWHYHFFNEIALFRFSFSLSISLFLSLFLWSYSMINTKWKKDTHTHIKIVHDIEGKRKPSVISVHKHNFHYANMIKSSTYLFILCTPYCAQRAKWNTKKKKKVCRKLLTLQNLHDSWWLCKMSEILMDGWLMVQCAKQLNPQVVNRQ